MLQEVNADLHIHTCLSPCGSLDMSPQKIVKEAIRKNLSIIAITDHNSAQNVNAVKKVAEGTDLFVIPGMEITTSEEVHIIGLFSSLDDVINIQEFISTHLQPGENNEDLFGLQVIANELDEVDDIDKRLLISATTLNIDEVINAIHENDGLAVAAHIDRESFSLIGQLGFIPDNLNIDCIEISKRLPLNEAKIKYKEYIQLPFITSSDAHELEDVGVSPIRLMIEKPDNNELKMALAGKEGRRIIIE